MIQKEDTLFKDETFPIIILPNRTSKIQSVDCAHSALHEAIEIKYFFEGTSTLLIGTETVIAKAGDVIIINPYEFHATVDYGDEISKYHSVMVSLDFFSGMGTGTPDLRHLLIGQGVHFQTRFCNSPRLVYILDRMILEFTEKQEAFRFAIRGLMLEFFSLLLRDGVQTDTKPVPLKHVTRYYNVIDPALCRIRDDYASHLTVDDLSDLCCVSKYHFCRIFKYVTGTSTMQYLTEYRLKIAEALLCNTEKSVSSIALQCGFDDESYFCRCYKKHFGHSPGKHRQRTKEI